MDNMEKCTICGQDCKEPTHLSIYVSGSEGVDACLNCRMAITEYIRQLKNIAWVARKQGYKEEIITRSQDK